jgi:hypothetical protein
VATALFRKLTFHLLEGRPGGLNTSGARRVTQMDFTLEDMEAVQSCLEGIDRNVHLAVERAAARLLGREPIQSIALFGNSTF